MRRGSARRIAFMLGALLVWCVGTYIPISGIDPIALEQLFRDQPDVALSMDFRFVQFWTWT
jgi:preprotein translocase subunit SecY